MNYEFIDHTGYGVVQPRIYVNFGNWRGRWHILFSQDSRVFQMECGRKTDYLSDPEIISESQLAGHKVCQQCKKAYGENRMKILLAKEKGD